MNDIGNQINIIIDNLSDKLGVTAEFLYPLLIKKAYTTAIIDFIFLLIFTAVIIFTVKFHIIVYIKRDSDGDTLFDNTNNEEIFIIITVLSLIFSIFAFVFSVVCIYSILNCLINPEWYAIKTILSYFK